MVPASFVPPELPITSEITALFEKAQKRLGRKDRSYDLARLQIAAHGWSVEKTGEHAKKSVGLYWGPGWALQVFDRLLGKFEDSGWSQQRVRRWMKMRVRLKHLEATLIPAETRDLLQTVKKTYRRRFADRPPEYFCAELEIFARGWILYGWTDRRFPASTQLLWDPVRADRSFARLLEFVRPEHDKENAIISAQQALPLRRIKMERDTIISPCAA